MGSILMFDLLCTSSLDGVPVMSGFEPWAPFRQANTLPFRNDGPTTPSDHANSSAGLGNHSGLGLNSSLSVINFNQRPIPSAYFQGFLKRTFEIKFFLGIRLVNVTMTLMTVFRRALSFQFPRLGGGGVLHMRSLSFPWPFNSITTCWVLWLTLGLSMNSIRVYDTCEYVSPTWREKLNMRK